MANSSDIGIGRNEFEQLRRSYRRRFKVALCAVAGDGRIRFGTAPCRNASRCAAAYRRAIREALRWGEPSVASCACEQFIWALPLMRNAKLLGGLVAGVSEGRLRSGRAGAKPLDLRAACEHLRLLGEEANLTNAALLRSRRIAARREQTRAEAIHEFKLIPYADVRQMYLLEEPKLLAAIRRDDLPEARGILNRILTVILHQAGGKLDLIKSFFMELVVTMCRTAVEVGGNAEELFGANFASIAELSRVDSEENLAPWLREMLERIMDSIRRHRTRPAAAVASRALEFMAEHFAEPISREDAARAAHVSSSHLSRIIKSQLGRSFTDLLNQMRVDRAAQLLVRTDNPLVLVGFETGFRDQSYFTKVFRRYMRVTPKRYRHEHQQTATE